MAICKCKMCGGDLNVTELDKVAECEYCGTTQTVPGADSEKKIGLFNRANRLRLNSEFDKAAGIYESIIAEFPEEAEAYWGALLCKYGIEYVTDPATGKKVPTCHRSSFDSVMEDESFEQACEYADAVARRLYREEAKRIEEIRKGIIEVSSKEAPYDIFICYKETDEDGGRTEDSTLAQDVYTLLVEKGYRVFFARVSLAQKLGQEYEPYIFAALNSARIMLVFGTDYEYMNAAWVKNEWSRFLQLIAAGQKKTLIPCYKNMDAYDMPKEFQKLQGVDFGTVGAMLNLLSSIETILHKVTPQPVPTQTAAPVQRAVANPAAVTTVSLLDRAFLFLEDGEWQSADEYAEKVLDIDPRCGEAYLVKAMADLKIRSRDALNNAPAFENNANTAKALRFGSDALKNEINGYITSVKEAEEAHRKAEEARRKEEEALKKTTLSQLAEQRKRLLPKKNLIAAGNYHTVGLSTDGTVVAVGFNGDGQCKTHSWKDVIAIAAGDSHTAGLRADGTVVAVGDNEDGRCDTDTWKDVVVIAAGDSHTVGLRADNTVTAVGDNEDGRCNTDTWKDIIAITTGGFHTVGLCADGTVVAVGDNENGECDTGTWRDVVQIAAGDAHTIGVHADGTVNAVGDNEDGRCNTHTWKLFQSVQTIEDELCAARKNAEEAHIARIMKLNREKDTLEAELPYLTGFFKNLKRKEAEARIAEIEAELKKLQG